MSTQILAAVRQHPQLSGNLKFTALEIAHRMNKAGYVRMAHQMMAWKTGYSLRTAYRHEARLTARRDPKTDAPNPTRVFAKTVYRTAGGYGWNLYKCLLPIPAFYRAAPALARSATGTGTLPPAKTAEAKECSIEQELRGQRRVLANAANKASPLYDHCREAIARLEALRRDGGSQH